MHSKIVIDGNSIYEIDEECLRQKEKRDEKKNDKKEKKIQKSKRM